MGKISIRSLFFAASRLLELLCANAQLSARSSGELSQMSDGLRTLCEELVVIAVFGCIGLTLFFTSWF
jgi:hypothetical protein